MGKFTEYKIQLKSLSEGVYTYDFHLGKKFFENMESPDIHDADLHVGLTLTYKRDLYTLDFKIEGTITLICDRCLDDLIMPVDTTYHINVKYGDDYNDEADDLLVIPQSDNYLNVAYMLYETVALGIPMKHVHPLGKCNRQMSAMLHKHRANISKEDADLQDQLIDEMDTMDTDDTASGTTATDPRWDALKGFNADSE